MSTKNTSRVPVLLYHALFEGNDNTENYALSAGAFEQHVQYLSKHGFSSVDFGDLLNDRLLDKNGKYVIISFDDGNYSDYAAALPILKRYGMKATFFITVNRVGSPGYVDWTHLREMAKEKMSIQSHSFNHVFLSDLDNKALMHELQESKQQLQKELSLPVDFISLPGGFSSRNVLRAAQEAGYKGVATSCPGLNRVGNAGKDNAIFHRFVITRSTPINTFQQIVHADFSHAAKERLVYSAKAAAKKTLGSRLYYRIWSTFFKYRT